jgi:deazaflavin-dependent oxidoreductase (nitroreductase family)
MTDSEAIDAALQQGGVIDITTIGRRSGRPRRIEIVFFHIDGRTWISGAPGRRAWMANLHADRNLTFHLKRGIQADLPATARIVTDEAERRAILEHITAAWGHQQRLEVYVARAPLIEVTFKDGPDPAG